MNRFDHDRWAELAAAHAFSALEPAEEAAFLAHVETCAACRRTVVETTQVVGELGRTLDPVEPPPALRERLLAEAAVTAQVPSRTSAFAPEPASLDERRRARSRSAVRALRRPAAVLAAAAALAGLVAGGALSLSRPESRSGMSAAQAFVGCLQDSGCQQVALRDGRGTVVGAVLVHHDGGVQLVAQGLTPNAADTTTYVLWALRSGGAASPVGVFDVPHRPMSVERLPRMTMPIREVRALAVTLEAGRRAPASGSSAVATGTLPA